MFVCICHALTDSDVNAASEEGATDEKEVFSRYGLRPQCGRCIPSMRGLLSCSGKCQALGQEEQGAGGRDDLP